jgi:hypothetical protein
VGHQVVEALDELVAGALVDVLSEVDVDELESDEAPDELDSDDDEPLLLDSLDVDGALAPFDDEPRLSVL